MNIWSISFLLALTSATCPCSDTSLCNNINKNYSKELYGFLPGGRLQLNDTSYFNWTYITAMAVRPPSQPIELMCEAHKNGARMINWIPGGFPFTDDTNTIMAYVQKIFNQTKSLYFDGVTFDYEGEMLWNQPQSAQYVNLINLTTQYFHQHLPGSTTSVCVPFDAFLQWGRQYDYYNLALAADYLYIMDYDSQTQIWKGPCVAAAVSPYENTKRGIQSYLNLGIDPSKLILGIPWYGREYQCNGSRMDNGITGHFCPLTPHNVRGVNCSGLGHGLSGEQPYAQIMNMIYTSKKNVTPVRWDDTQKTHNVNGIQHGMEIQQFWFDDPESLLYKYTWAKKMGLRGLGPFQFGDLLYDGTDQEKLRAQQMWSVFDVFYQNPNETILTYSFEDVTYTYDGQELYWKMN